MARYAIVNSGRVETVSEWDGVTPWEPPVGTSAVPCPDHVSTGYAYDGQTWTPPGPATPSVPIEIPQWQARTALHRAGLLSQIEAAVAASGNPEVQIAWQYAPNIRRDSAFVLEMASALGLSNAQLDGLFIAASEIP